jgi:hypothetical protein
MSLVSCTLIEEPKCELETSDRAFAVFICNCTIIIKEDLAKGFLGGINNERVEGLFVASARVDVNLTLILTLIDNQPQFL